MAECTAGFELGTLAATISTGDAGNATAWNTVSLGGVGTAVYDNAHVIGTKSGKLAASGGGAIPDALVWSTALAGPLTDYYWRVYLYLTALPNATGTFRVIWSKNATDQCWNLRCSSAGVLFMENAAFSTIATFSTTMQTNAWTRFEGHTIHGTGAIEVKVFLDATSTTPTETKTLTGQTLRANMTSVSYGVGSLSTTAWFDALVMGASAYPGPVPVVPANTVAPVVSGTTVEGQTLSVTDGTWTGTAPITYTYKWQRGGVDIGGATNNTYLLTGTDVGTMIRAVVTATNAAGPVSANSNAVGPITAPPPAPGGGTRPSRLLLGSGKTIVLRGG